MDRIFSCILLQLERIEDKLDLLTLTADEHGQMLDEQAKTLDDHRMTMDEQRRILDEQGRTLREHGKILNLLLEKSEENSRSNKHDGIDKVSECNDSSSVSAPLEKQPKNVLFERTKRAGKSHESTEEGIQTEINRNTHIAGGRKLAAFSNKTRSPEVPKSSGSCSHSTGPSLDKSSHEGAPSTKLIDEQELICKITTLLNELTPQNLEHTANQIGKLPINEPHQINTLSRLIIDKAITNTSVGEDYAKLSKILCSDKLFEKNEKIGDENQLDFGRALFETCQALFEHGCVKTKNATKLKKSVSKRSEGMQINRLTSLCQFIGELFKLDLLKASIVHTCITFLLKNPNEERLGRLCKLLTTVGSCYEVRVENNDQDLQPIMEELAKLRNGHRKKSLMTWRIRYMIDDVLDLYEHAWLPKRNRPRQ